MKKFILILFLAAPSVAYSDWWDDLCSTGICGDFDYSGEPDQRDLLFVIGATGHPINCPYGGGGGIDISEDGFIDFYDVIYWDWTRGLTVLNYCYLPLLCCGSDYPPPNINISPPINYPMLQSLIITGKRDGSDVNKTKDHLYLLSTSGNPEILDKYDIIPDTGNNKVISRKEGGFYVINSFAGIFSDDGTLVVPFGSDICIEPLYGESSTVRIGTTKRDNEYFGRPIFDAVFDSNIVYITPVVVLPESNSPYIAAAKLEIFADGSPYQVRKIYYEQFDGIPREIEVNDNDEVFIADCNSIWKFTNESVYKKTFISPSSLCFDNFSKVLYVASSIYESNDHSSVTIKGLDPNNLNVIREITITNLQHVTGIAVERFPYEESLYVVGYKWYPEPTWIDIIHLPIDSPALYKPYIAVIPPNQNVVNANILNTNGNLDLALPLSIVWTVSPLGECFPESDPNYSEWVSVGKPICWCYPRQCHGDGDGVVAAGGGTKIGYWYVGSEDLTIFAQAFLVKEPPKGPGLLGEPNICYDLDHTFAAGGGTKIGYWRVGAEDLTIFSQSFLVKELPKGSGVPADCP